MRIKTGAPRPLSDEQQQQLGVALAFEGEKLITAALDEERSDFAKSVYVEVVRCPLGIEERVHLDHVDRSYCKDISTEHKCGALAAVHLGEPPQVACLFRVDATVCEA